MNPAAGLDLRDIHAAAPPPFWPPAPGWWLLAGLLIAALIVSAVILLGYYRRYRQRQRILAELDRLEQSDSCDAGQFTTALSILLRRVALMRYPRTEVASLNGDAWLRFLDKTGGNDAFSNGPGRVLASAPYAVQAAKPADPALLELARDWIKVVLEKRI